MSREQQSAREREAAWRAMSTGADDFLSVHPTPTVPAPRYGLRARLADAGAVLVIALVVGALGGLVARDKDWTDE